MGGTQIDVHGMKVEEAIKAITKAANEAVKRGELSLTVIHGLGSDDPSSSIRGRLRHEATTWWGPRGWRTLETQGGGRTVIYFPIC